MGNQPGGIMARWENVQVGKQQSGITGGGKMAWWENDIGKMGRIRSVWTLELINMIVEGVQ